MHHFDILQDKSVDLTETICETVQTEAKSQVAVLQRNWNTFLSTSHLKDSEQDRAVDISIKFQMV